MLIIVHLFMHKILQIKFGGLKLYPLFPLEFDKPKNLIWNAFVTSENLMHFGEFKTVKVPLFVVWFWYLFDSNQALQLTINNIKIIKDAI